MRKLIFILSLWGICSCTSQSEKQIALPAVQSLAADSISIPPTLLAVTRMFVMKDMLVAYEAKQDSMFSFWKLPQCEFLFRNGVKGRGPTEFLTLDRTYGETLDGFQVFEMQTNRVKQVSVDASGRFQVSADKVLPTEKRMLNRFLFLKENTWCFLADDEDSEYTILKEDGETISVGAYPKDLLPKRPEELNRFVYNKLTVANPSGDKFAAFYAYAKLCRIYSYEGELLQETLLEKPTQSVENRKACYASFPYATDAYIYILTTGTDQQPVLEVWNWQAEPVARYGLDKTVSAFAVSEEHQTLYAVCNDVEGVIYTYKLP